MLLLIVCLLNLSISIIQIVIGEHIARPVVLGYLFFITTLVFIGLTVLFVIDLFSSRYVVHTGTVMNIDRKIIQVLGTDSKVRRYKISQSDVLQKLAAGQKVSMRLKKLTRVPITIEIIE